MKLRRLTLFITFVFTFTFILASSERKAVSPELIQQFNKSEKLLYQYKLKEAKKVLEEILKVNPDYGDANRKMAFIEYYYYGDYDKALKHIKKAMDKQPENAENYIVSGDIYFADSQYENAVKSYKKAVSLNSGNIEIYYSTAQAYIRLNKSKEARKILEKGNAINPLDVKINAALHLLYVKDGEYEKAYSIWKKGNVSDTESLGYFKEWDELYRSTLENKTDNKHMQLGNLYAKLLLYDEAELEFKKALKAEPDNDEKRRKLNEISLFIKFRDELKECFYSYYPRRILNGIEEEAYLKNKVEKIYMQMLALFPDIKYNYLDFNCWASYTLNNEIQKKFNVIINCFPVDGFMGCYFGYVVGSSVEEISHWGKKIDIGVVLTKNNVINIFLNWYFKENGLGGWSETVVDENNVVRTGNKTILDSRYAIAYDHWEKATNGRKRKELIEEAEKNDKDLFNKPTLEVFYSSLLKLRLEFKAMDELINEAEGKFNSEEEIKSYVINYLVYDVKVPLTNLHEGQHAIDTKYYKFEEWEREYRAMMSEPVYGKLQLLDMTDQLQQDIGDNSTNYGKAHTKIFNDIVNYINYHREDYPVIDCNKNIMMQLSKLSSEEIKEISKNVFEQVYPGERFE